MKYHNGPSPHSVLINYSKKFNDRDRREFLDAIDDKLVRLDAWEKNFIVNTQRQQDFTLRQRASIDQMILKHNESVHWSKKAEVGTIPKSAK